MPLSLRRKSTGKPPNTLKKKHSVIASDTTNYDEQPWATAHLYQNNYTLATTETSAMSPRRSDDAPIPIESEQVHNDDAAMAAEDTDAVTPLPNREVYIDPIAGHSNVTIPARPTRKHTYSECFDLDDLAPGTQIRSPSGHMLSAEQVASRADRPMGIRERQETIRRKVAEQRQKGLGNEVTIVGDAKGKAEREKERREQQRRRAKMSMGERLVAKWRDLWRVCFQGVNQRGESKVCM